MLNGYGRSQDQATWCTSRSLTHHKYFQFVWRLCRGQSQNNRNAAVTICLAADCGTQFSPTMRLCHPRCTAAWRLRERARPTWSCCYCRCTCRKCVVGDQAVSFPPPRVRMRRRGVPTCKQECILPRGSTYEHTCPANQRKLSDEALHEARHERG